MFLMVKINVIELLFKYIVENNSQDVLDEKLKFSLITISGDLHI
jgi:hypothetical protein